MPDRPALEPRQPWPKLSNAQIDRAWTLGLLAAALFLFTVNLGGLPLRDWDEGIVARVSLQIWQAKPGSQGWLYPILWTTPYQNKPPLLHILTAGAYALGGVNEWTARLPGALLTAISVPVLFGIGREIFVRRTTALFAALVYLTWLPVVRHGRLAMLDGAVVCFFLLMLWCLLRSRRQPQWALGVGIGFGLMCLTKGAMGLLLGAIAAVFLAWDAPRLFRSRYLWGGILLGSVPAIGWYVAQWMHYGNEFLDKHLLEQSFSRMWEPVYGRTGPIWYYLLELLKYGWPWLMFLPLGLATVWQHRNMSWAKLILVWGGGYFLFISLMSTKLPWYIQPLYPVLALAIAVYLDQLWWNSRSLFDRQTTQPYARWLMAILGLLALGSWGGSLYFGLFSPESKPALHLTLAAFGVTLLAATVLMARQDRQFLAVLFWGAYVSLALFMSSDYWVWELEEDYPVKPVAAMIQQAPPEGRRVFTSHPYYRPSLSFYSNRPVLPQPIDRLQTRWREDANPFLLVNPSEIEVLNLQHAEVLGQAEGWVLIRRDRPVEP